MNKFYGEPRIERVYDYLANLPELKEKFEFVKPQDQFNNSHGAIRFIHISKCEELPVPKGMEIFYQGRTGAKDGYFVTTNPHGILTKVFDDDHKTMWNLFTTKDRINVKFYEVEELVGWLLL